MNRTVYVAACVLAALLPVGHSGHPGPGTGLCRATRGGGLKAAGAVTVRPGRGVPLKTPRRRGKAAPPACAGRMGARRPEAERGEATAMFSDRQ